MAMQGKPDGRAEYQTPAMSVDHLGIYLMRSTIDIGELQFTAHPQLLPIHIYPDPVTSRST